MVSTHRYCHAPRQRTRGALTGAVQGDPGDVQEPRPTLTGMNTMYDAPADGGFPASAPGPSRPARSKKWFRWGVGAAVFGLLAGVVIKAADGTTWTWHVVSDTVVRKNGAKTTTSALSAGETVFAGGPVVSGARDARVIIIRPSGPAGSGPANPSGSQSAQTSLS